MVLRTPLIIGNWKMHKTVAEAVAYVTTFLPHIAQVTGIEIGIAPVFTALSSVVAAAAGSALRVLAQNVAAEGPTGAFTGEVAAEMLREVGCYGVIVGHSERRRYYGETDTVVAAKVRRALNAQLLPVACIGETLEEREAGTALSVVERQLRAIAGTLTPDEAPRIVLAYEPVWAIGTGRAATPEVVQVMHRHLRATWEECFGAPAAEALRILYGGSVTADNIAAFTSLPDVDGALVGGASLSPNGFAQLIQRSQVASA
ncbi:MULTISPECIES: triose-phosphate isomerase [Chloracidobacterium]|jgi:triosephosphate isomerase|uniref:Triosephosphate isomerase n=1 Tax=Chloracidobacterium thermophilum (strain B) TaxID=981222 RepID=G2LDS1_CHLTF|nr:MULTISPECIES: triose-phosphate isomerase [Chloracidobacterium]AEP12929.1 triosephosphate isomerase [Chloracidobacterium thermophilum B]QUV78648.1 triose-phosphate isomerase [Chloracidobacterium thermophilum]QUV81693.1 triose-phosphate isomerase [Chloracidobacterium sp. D]